MVQNPVWFQQNLKKEKKKEGKKKKLPGKRVIDTSSCRKKFFFPSSPPLVSSRFPGLFTLGFPSVSAEAAAQMQAAILYSATSSHRELARETPEVWRCAFQNKMITDAHKR